MANNDKEAAVLSDLTGKATGDAGLVGSVVESLSTEVIADPPVSVVGDSERPTAKEAVSHPPVTVLDSISITRLPIVSGSSNIAPTNAHPKRFSAMNINKKFLETTSSASGTSQSSSGSTSNKSGGPVSRPPTQNSASHSRLVTTKLTATSQSSTTGPGWSRPSSATPPVAASPSAHVNHTPTPAPAPAPAPAAPQLPHAGKVIQPQPRAATSNSQSGGSQKDGAGGSNKPVWGNYKSAAAKLDTKVQNDFPTAAEVAQGRALRITTVNSSVRTAKLNDQKEAAETAAAHKQARMEEADTFRGVHLDPNAHHWDEMEEDDDNFLDGVIEFGDGRQYKVQPADVLPQPSPPRPLLRTPAQEDSESMNATAESVAPVSKEERFADDFDRSWPRSRNCAASSTQESLHPRHQPVPKSPASSQQTHHSPQESSRVLFNERSNRLEPYSNVHPSHRPGQGPYPPRRGDPSLSPTDSRHPRDVHLLQKLPIHDMPSRSRGAFGPGPSNSRNEQLRDQEPSRDGSQPSPYSHGQSSDFKRGRDVFNGDSRGRRLSAMGPPPFPPQSIRDRSKDSGRQLPPHLSQTPSPVASSLRRVPSRDASLQSLSISTEPLLLAASPHSGTVPLVSEVHSQPIVSPVDMEEVHKDFMQTAAARAKQRRQQEEEEREKEKERARRKADELAARTTKSSAKASEPEPAKVEIIQETVTSTLPQNASPETVSGSPISSSNQQPPIKGAPRRSQPPQGTPRQTLDFSPTHQRRSSQASATSSIVPTSPAAQVESWRSKANPLPPPTPRQVSKSMRHVVATSASQPLVISLAETVESLTVLPDEELEIVDFSDLGRFVGVSPSATSPGGESSPEATNVTLRSPSTDPCDHVPPRDIAGTLLANDIAPWRRKGAHDHTGKPPAQSQCDPQKANGDATSVDDADERSPTSPTPCPAELDPGFSQTVIGTSALGTQRTNRHPTVFREAAMSALDDAMSRIKGALDGMQAHDAPIDTAVDGSKKPPHAPVPVKYVAATEPRWIPPAFRTRKQLDSDVQPREVFDSTGSAPPQSPKPAWNTCTVRLSKSSVSLEPLTRKQSSISRGANTQVKWDILSFTPTPYEMRRDFCVNDIFPQFRRPPSTYKGKHKYRVALPRARKTSGVVSDCASGWLGPKVHLPANPTLAKPTAGGAFGRPAPSDGQSTWRKATTNSVKLEGTDTVLSESGLSTVSRSPPPELPPLGDTSVTTIPRSDSTKTDGAQLQRTRSRPKMPPGSAVAFYRNSRIDAIHDDAQTSVNFTVSSELEELPETQVHDASGKPQHHVVVTSPILKIPELGETAHSSSATLTPLDPKSQPPSPEFSVPSLIQSKTESSDESTDRNPPTPPTAHHVDSTWTKSPLNFSVKESPARAPDPEHLKAVWSQAPDHGRLPVVNSLEGIADDLTALPFTLQDVKSEDGETPPPTSTAPSRMSLHDVTRAFQQVPSSSSTASAHRSTSPSTSISSSSQRNFTYTLPPPNPNMRPAYAPYGSPAMGHSPSPTLVYSHPITPNPAPGRMPVNGHTPLYGQPLWMPPTATTSQPHGGMFRPVTSPYPAQLMSYPTPSNNPSLYAAAPPANMQNPPTPQQQNGGSQTRGRGMSVMSPVIPHAGHSHHSHPNAQVYPGSPALMHATPVMQVTHGHGYMPGPLGGGQIRTDSTPGQPPIQPQSGHHPSSSGYTSVSPASFVRPTW